LLIVFNSSPNDPGAVLARGQDSGDRASVGAALLHNVFDAACGVIEMFRAQGTMRVQEFATLSERYRVGDYAAQSRYRHSGSRDQIVNDAEGMFPNDVERVAEQKVIVFRDRTSQGVFNRNNGSIGPAAV
jgi:hypothetical protein